MNIVGYEIKDEVISEIGKFAILWNEFERRFTNYGKNGKSGLEQCADMMACNPVEYADFYERFREYLQKQMNYSGIEKTRDFVECFFYTQHARRNPDPTSGEERARQRKIDYICHFIDGNGSKKEKTLGCLYIIHRYRDNLMHGLKNLSGLNGQFTVFQEINVLLEQVMSGRL